MNTQYAISAVSVSDEGITLIRPLWRTNDKGSWERVSGALHEITDREPRLRAAVTGNRRRVKVVRVENAKDYAFHLSKGTIDPRTQLGSEFGCAKDASRAMGLADLTMGHLFAKARKAQNTFDPEVSCRGLVFCYADQRLPKTGM